MENLKIRRSARKDSERIENLVKERKQRKLPLTYIIMREHLHRSFRKYQAFQY